MSQCAEYVDPLLAGNEPQAINIIDTLADAN